MRNIKYVNIKDVSLTCFSTSIHRQGAQNARFKTTCQWLLVKTWHFVLPENGTSIFVPKQCWRYVFKVSICNAMHLIGAENCLQQRFSNFFQVGTTFISQNVLRTTLLLGW